MSMKHGKAKSPYQRHSKAPYRYSELYCNWKAAVLRCDDDEIKRLGALHSQRYAAFEPVELWRKAA